jgi:hypothetical protein
MMIRVIIIVSVHIIIVYTDKKILKKTHHGNIFYSDFKIKVNFNLKY